MGVGTTTAEVEGVDHEVVIVGAGIAGLATALALHRKGIKSVVVLERSEGLRSSGGAMGIWENGWRALEQLGVASALRRTAIPLSWRRIVQLDKDKQHEHPMPGEYRSLKRIDLIKALAKALPPNTIHFGHQVVSVSLQPYTTYPVLQLLDGSSIVSTVLIGCDGVNSVIADFLEVKPTKMFNLGEIGGITTYSNGHSFAHEYTMMRNENALLGRTIRDNKSVSWYISLQHSPADAKVSREPEMIRQSALELLNNFPEEYREMIKSADLDSLYFTRIRYRAPLDLLKGRFCKGTVTVAGDALHVMGSFLGQGGSACLEDAIVLARSLAEKLQYVDTCQSGRKKVLENIGEALDLFVNERRLRVVSLSIHSYLIGLLSGTSSRVKMWIYNLLLAIFFRNRLGHTKYDCGAL